MPSLHSSRPSSSGRSYKLKFMIGSCGYGLSKILRFHKHKISNQQPFQHHRWGRQPRFSCLFRMIPLLSTDYWASVPQVAPNCLKTEIKTGAVVAAYPSRHSLLPRMSYISPEKCPKQTVTKCRTSNSQCPSYEPIKSNTIQSIVIRYTIGVKYLRCTL